MPEATTSQPRSTGPCQDRRLAGALGTDLLEIVVDLLEDAARAANAAGRDALAASHRWASLQVRSLC